MYARKCERCAGCQPVPVGEGCNPVSEGRKHVSEGCKPVSEGSRALLAETPRHMKSYSNLLVVGASREGGVARKWAQCEDCKPANMIIVKFVSPLVKDVSP